MPDRGLFSVYWARSAARDLASIIDYISSESVENAQRGLSRIQRTAARLARFPQRGRIVPELKEQGVLIYREILHPPWRIIYRIEGKRVLVAAVLDARRSLEDLLLERFLQ